MNEQGTDNNKGLKKVDATLTIRCNVECPHCEEQMDLMQTTALTDDGYIYTELLSNDGFGKANWGELIKCDACKEMFVVGDVDY